MRLDPEYSAYRQREREISSLVPQHEAKKRRILGPAYEQMKRSMHRPPSNANKMVQSLSASTDDTPTDSNKTSISVLPKHATAKGQYQYPCALCPEFSTDGLVKVHDGKKNGKQLYAHKICVTFTPTTWCSPDPQTGEELVFGFSRIEKERWNLKCGLCNDKHGTKVSFLSAEGSKSMISTNHDSDRFNVPNPPSVFVHSMLHAQLRKTQELSSMLL